MGEEGEEQRHSLDTSTRKQGCPPHKQKGGMINNSAPND